MEEKKVNGYFTKLLSNAENKKIKNTIPPFDLFAFQSIFLVDISIFTLKFIS